MLHTPYMDSSFIASQVFTIDDTYRDQDCSHISGLLIEVLLPQDS
jgi:hypothetical protein